MPTPSRILHFFCLFFASVYLSVCGVRAQQPLSVDTAKVLAFNGGKALTLSDSAFIVTDVATQENIRIVRSHPSGDPYYSAISEDGRWFIYSTKAKKEWATYIYDLAKNGALSAQLPFALESAAITADGESAFFIHSKTFWKAKLAAYQTQDWRLQTERAVGTPTSSVAVNADGSQLLLAAGSIITAMHPETLKKEKINWEKSRLSNLAYNPTMHQQYASINHKNTIEVRDLQEDSVLHTIHVDTGEITQLAYTPTGDALISLDDRGNLATWNLADHAVQPRDQVDILPTPLIAYSPETNLLLGFGMSFVFHPRYSRPSIITPAVAYGFNGQIQASLTANQFSKRGWHFANQISYVNNNRSYFFGLGHLAQRRIKTVYHNNVFSLTGSLTKGIGDRFFAGVGYQIRHDSPLDFDASTALPIPDNNGGLLVGIGPVLRFDTRNDLFFPTTGYYVDVSLTRFGSWLKSDYGFTDVRIDYRGFHALPILTTGTTLAVQALYQGTFDGEAPFYQLPYLSADRILRGVWRNLYIDRQAVALQAELRSNFSNIDPRYGYVIFAGSGDVAPNFFKGYNPDIIGVFGVGYRQQVIPKRKLQSRIDVSYTTKGDFGVFGGLGLSF